MTRIDRRLRLWAWIAQRQAAATVQGEEAVIALRSRAFPENALMSFIFGRAAGWRSATRPFQGQVATCRSASTAPAARPRAALAGTVPMPA
ncbi:MAG TPA: hypothetical protein VHW06_20895 [Streptosporangiaceae bacterium]|nr:hypothetical protein [Streptosporangiaceae bacterium]